MLVLKEPHPILIQKFDKRKIISTNGISLFHSAHTYKKVEGKGVTIEPRLTAVLVGTSLKFKSFHWVRHIFDMSNYFKEATKEDVYAFSTNDTVSFQNIDEFLKMADSWILHKVNLVHQSGILQNVPLNIIKAIADEFKVPLNLVNDKILFQNDKREVKELLRLLDEDYYKSPLSQEQYITNSKRKRV